MSSLSLPQPDPATIQAFFETLYPNVTEGYLVLSHPDPMRLNAQGKPLLRSDWFDLGQASLVQVAQAAARMSQRNTVYFGVALVHPDCVPSPGTRGKSDTVVNVPGLWFDLDLAYGHHAASALPATDTQALDFLQTLPTPPSLILHSGGGLYGWWVFREPFLITNETDREGIAHLAERFTATLVEAGKHHGWTLDKLGDLARVLRPPGTINHKYGKLVETIHESGLRYNPSDFDWLIDLPQPSKAFHNGAAVTGQPDLVRIAEHYGTVFAEKSQTELAGAHPQHGSSTGDNFNVNPGKGLWRCHRCTSGGDALSLIAVCEELLDCGAAKSGALSGDLFKRVVTIANEKFQAGIRLQGSQQPAAQGGHAPAATSEDESIPYSDVFNAKRLVTEHGTDLHYCTPWNTWLAWAGTSWERDTTGEVMRRAKATTMQMVRDARQWLQRLAAEMEHAVLGENGEAIDLLQLPKDKADTLRNAKKHQKAAFAFMAHAASTLNHRRLVAMLAQAESEQSEIGIPVKPEALDADPWLLNCHNGTLDLRTGTLRPHDRADLLTKCLTVPYDPAATCPTFQAFLSRILDGKASLISFLQRAVGYVLTGVIREHVLLILWGTGRNGKSTFLNVLRALLGPYAMKAPSELLMVSNNDRHPTERADLCGKRLVSAIETEQGRRLAEVFVKEATGGDPIRARRMREDFWEFQPTHKVFLATNYKPAITGTDTAIWERIRLIPFSITIPKAERDTTLPDKLTAELPGILAWAVQGCLAWQQEGLGEPDEVQAATADYRAEQDLLGAFIAECCTVLPSAHVSAAKLYGTFEKWGEVPLSQRQFGILITERGFERYKNNGVWYKGIGLNASENDTNYHDHAESRNERNHTEPDLPIKRKTQKSTFSGGGIGESGSVRSVDTTVQPPPPTAMRDNVSRNDTLDGSVVGHLTEPSMVSLQVTRCLHIWLKVGKSRKCAACNLWADDAAEGA